ncbi:hypothetical protein IEO21_09205 [Rhodonia placenta]|uniref:Uncharacterized protein n=1 Tax=Rhodonia placenta TaxID=104341 RepID=A0A8H7NV81_9APHY|nr:hypothetical protein IEO21_09205 [Postia placenta]
MRISPKHFKKRSSDALDAREPSVAGLSGSVTASAPPSTETALIYDTTRSPESVSISDYSFASATVTTSPTLIPTSSIVPSASASAASDISSNSAIPVGTVVGACVGAFAGAGLIIFLVYTYSKRHLSGAGARDGGRGENWKKLHDSHDGAPNSPSHDSSREMEEKNRALFKKSTPSVRTTRTKLSDEDHGFGIPPFEFSKYHPNLAQELALEKPAPAFVAHRGDSGVSWDGSTVHDDSFLSMRSVRVDSGTMSPTLGLAKPTPVATSSAIHKWESAEVLTLGEEDVAGPKEVQNPFADVAEQRRSVANPFFNAQELHRSPTNRNRSRSNSRSGSRTSRISRTRSASDTRNASYRQSERLSNPFADVQEVPVYRVSPPAQHEHTDSVASNSSGNMFGEHAMKSLIAALDLTQEEVEERLRAVSMHESTMSRFSTITGDEAIATMRAFPMPPATEQRYSENVLNTMQPSRRPKASMQMSVSQAPAGTSMSSPYLAAAPSQSLHHDDAFVHEKHGPPGVSSVTWMLRLDVRCGRTGTTPSTGAANAHNGAAPSSMSPGRPRLSRPTMHQPSPHVRTTATRSPAASASSSGSVGRNAWRTVRVCACASSSAEIEDAVEYVLVRYAPWRREARGPGTEGSEMGWEEGPGWGRVEVPDTGRSKELRREPVGKGTGTRETGGRGVRWSDADPASRVTRIRSGRTTLAGTVSVACWMWGSRDLHRLLGGRGDVRDAHAQLVSPRFTVLPVEVDAQPGSAYEHDDEGDNEPSELDVVVAYRVGGGA